jgi:sec-independent protein translocase protein TatB
MNFLGMGPMEVAVILVVALIIFGPGKLPEIGAQAGKMLRDFKNATADLTSEFQDSIDDMQATMGEMRATVTDMQRETKELANLVPDSLNLNGNQTAPMTGASTAPPALSSGAPADAQVAVADPPAGAVATNGAQPVEDAPATATAAPRAPTKADPLADFGS